VSLGELDHVGNAAADHWDNPAQDDVRSSTAPGSARSLPLPDAKGILLVLLNIGGPNPRTEQVEGWVLADGVLTLPNSVAGHTPGHYGDDQWEVTAIRLVGALTNPVAPATTVRVVNHLGAADQEADSYLMGLVPAQWTAEHRLRGLCYSVVTLDLERTQFQSGPPGITADISGALVLDRRTGTTAWSNNPALLIDHWLRSEMGYGVGLADVDAASVIAAANACDAPVSFASGSTMVTEARYTCNGIVTSDAAKEVVLADLAESMAGWASYSGGWRVQAGVWAPSVMDLTDDDLAGPITIVQAGEPSSELFNGVRGQYIPAGSAVPAEFEPYQVAAFLAADGRALWTDLDLPFTNSKSRAKNICRVLIEQARNGLILHFPAQMRAWPLQAGDRVRVSSTEYGWALKTFRVTDWGFGITAPVGLTLQEDAPEAYDEADAVAADPTPNTQLPDPWVVPALGGLTLESGTAHLQRLGDGTIISRVKASWPRVTAPYMTGGRIELAWRAAGSNTWVTLNADPDDTSTYITGVADRKFIFVTVVLINAHGARSRAFYAMHQVVGKTEPPVPVQFTGYSTQPGVVRIGYQPCPDLDYDYTLLRVGASWAAGTALPGLGDKTGYDWSWPAIGTHTVWAVHIDTSGNLSAPASLSVAVT
ncbi:MAG: hypothetical protein O9341_13785, partial [Paucibacter sp.]|nr:hypothetical protein [Roseateles sp.]